MSLTAFVEKFDGALSYGEDWPETVGEVILRVETQL
jgi:hypothetical protein